MWDPMGGKVFVHYLVTLLTKRMLGLAMLNPAPKSLNPFTPKKGPPFPPKSQQQHLASRLVWKVPLFYEIPVLAFDLKLHLVFRVEVHAQGVTRATHSRSGGGSV